MTSSSTFTARNVARYPVYAAGVAFTAWMPVFVLYLLSRVSLVEVLQLEAIYYATVVLFEVPSGYFSDRVGRRATLIVAAGSLVAAYLLFALGDGFAVFAAAEVLLASGLAFNSGTDTSFHLDSLSAADREDEYPDREARISRLTFLGSAAAALAGGALGVWDLRAAYVASALGAGVALMMALSFREPPHAVSETPTGSFGASLAACARHVRSEPLRWIFALTIVATVVNHIPYEFYQPYLGELGVDNGSWPPRWTPLVAGVHVMLAQLAASFVAGRSVALARRLGIRRHLLLSVLVQVLLIGAMALWLHPVIAVLLVGRSIPRAMQAAPTNAEVAPRVPQQIRATYLSLQSLSARLAYAGFLFGLSVAFPQADEAGWSTLRDMLRVGVIVGTTGLVALAVAASAGRRSQA